MKILSYISSMQDAILKTMSRTILAVTQLGKQSKVQHTSIYCAFLRTAPQMRSDMDHTVLPANYTMPAFTPHPQNVTAL